jgi:hypothetical protein
MAVVAGPKLSTDLREPASPRCEQQTPALMAPDEDRNAARRRCL